MKSCLIFLLLGFSSSIWAAESNTSKENQPQNLQSSEASTKKNEVLVQDAKSECRKQGKEGLELVDCVKKLRDSK